MRILPWFCLAVFACREGPILLTGSRATIEQAFELMPDRKLKGKIPRGKSETYFRISIAENAMFRAELSPIRGADSRLELLTAEGKILHTADDNGSSLAEEIFPLFLPPQVYYLRVQADAQAEEEFIFFYRLFKPPRNIELEPNNTPDTATPVAERHATGFLGPEFFWQNGVKTREQDCFLFTSTDSEKNRAEFSFTGIEGYFVALRILNSAGEVLAEAQSTKAGERIHLTSIAIPADHRFVACVSSYRKLPEFSRDFYELSMQLTDIPLKAELEPNNNPTTATDILSDRVEGEIATFDDHDYYTWLNRRDYPVILRVQLSTPAPKLLQLEAGLPDLLRTFADSLDKTAVMENLRLDSGEKALLLVRCGKTCKRKNFAKIQYTLHCSESQASDENEAEPNDSRVRAEVLVDLGQKWGFFNPPDDVDFYRLVLGEKAVRDIILETKLSCRLRLEHLRGERVLAVQSGKAKLLYNAEFVSDDLLKLSCIGSGAGRDRSYRLSLREP